jgi:hypothetical protein
MRNEVLYKLIKNDSTYPLPTKDLYYTINWIYYIGVYQKWFNLPITYYRLILHNKLNKLYLSMK